MSTRLYIAVVSTTVLAIALMLLGLATYVVLAFSLHGQLDRGLAAEGQQLRDYFLTSQDSPLVGNTLPVSATPFEAVAPSGSVFRLVGVDGRVFAQSVGNLTAPLEGSAYGASGAWPQSLTYETVEHGGTRFRVSSLPLQLPAQAQGILQIARPLAPVEQTLAHLRIVLIAGAGVSLLVAVGAGLLLAHIAAKPIEDVASATARIRAFGEDDERLVSRGHLQEPHWLVQSLNNLLDRTAHAEATASEASTFRAQCTGYVQRQLGRLIVQQRNLNDFLRTELHPGDPAGPETPAPPGGSAQSFLQTDPRGWIAAYDDVVAWLEAQTDALERWVHHLPLYMGAQEGLDIEREEISLAPMLFGICEERHEQYGDSVQIERQLVCTPRLRGDRQSLHDALAALVDNACYSTPAGGTVTVTLHCAGPDVTISVADTGPGIAPEELPHVFTRFYRAADASHGHGLGLPFAHDVVVQHGGTLTVASTPGEGSTLTARLPLEQNGAQ